MAGEAATWLQEKVEPWDPNARSTCDSGPRATSVIRPTSPATGRGQLSYSHLLRGESPPLVLRGARLRAPAHMASPCLFPHL